MRQDQSTDSKTDDAVRAAWLYYVDNKSQDDIAQILNISRQAAQRLVAYALKEKLVRFEIKHPLARPTELAELLKTKYDLHFAAVAPTDPTEPNSIRGVIQLGITHLERALQDKSPRTIGIGTGRTLHAMIESLTPLSCPQHKIVSIVGNLNADGSIAYYNVVFGMAHKVEARHYAMPLPVFVSTPDECQILQAQPLVQRSLALAAESDITFVGIGQLDETAPVLVDGFLSKPELKTAIEQGAVGEICGWLFNAEGELAFDALNARVASAPLPNQAEKTIIGISPGKSKREALKAALLGRLINGVICDEATAEFLLV